MNFEINNQVAVVTGANRGIGKERVKSLIQHGAKKVYLAVRNTASTKDLINEYGSKVQPIQADLTNPNDIIQLANTASDTTLVINNAGVLELSNPLNVNFEHALNKEINVNVFGLVRMAQAFTPVLEKNKRGAFVQLNSVASMKNFLELTSYSASKAASYSVTQGLRELLTPKGIHVLSVHPGPIATDMAVKAGMEEGGEPASVVSEAIISALKSGEFHIFPDSVARDFGGAYQSYAQNIIEAATE